MKVERLLTGISQLVTASGAGPRRGVEQGELTIIADAGIAVTDGRISWSGRMSDWSGTAAATFDLAGRAILPGLVDPHTHAIWAGERLADFEARARGVSYQKVLAAGGGIYSTIEHTAAAEVDDLVRLAEERILNLTRAGATTIEIKSGYGFSLEAELNMLEVAHRLKSKVPARLVPTLLVHVPPRDRRERAAYLDMVAGELVLEVARRGLAQAIDVFVEQEAFSVAEAERLLAAAQGQGLAVKLHADQFHTLGGVELAVRHHALSVDHLEASGEEQIRALAESSTIATVLPGVSLHLGLPAAPGRKLIDAGAAVAVATDLNPGSSPLYSTALALALSVRLNGLSPAEALVAATANAAAALGLDDVGRLETGCRADFLVLKGADWRELPYAMGAHLIDEVWIRGKQV